MMNIKITATSRYLCIFVFVCLIAGCSFVKTFYNNAPTALAWWLDDYFDFTNDQKAILNPALNHVHDWHRNSQLPQYIATLQNIKLVVNENNISSKQVCDQIESMKISLKTLQMSFTPVISEIAPLISDEQLTFLSQKLSNRAKKWKSEWWQETLEAQIEVRLEKTEEYAEKVYGNLSSEQRTLIKQKLLSTPTQPQIIYAEILRRNDDVLKSIHELRNAEMTDSQKYVLIKSGLERLQYSPNEEYQKHADLITQRTCEMIADLHVSTNQLQKQHASDWVGKLEKQLSNF